MTRPRGTCVLRVVAATAISFGLCAACAQSEQPSPTPPPTLYKAQITSENVIGCYAQASLIWDQSNEPTNRREYLAPERFELKRDQRTLVTTIQAHSPTNWPSGEWRINTAGELETRWHVGL